MPIVMRRADDIEAIRRASRLAAWVVAEMSSAVAPGVTTADLDEVARVCMADAGAVSACKNHPTFREGEGYPGYSCISVNEEVVHGVPGQRALTDGDVVTLDVSLSLNGYHGSRATTIPVGKPPPQLARLLDVCNGALSLAIREIQPGRYWSEVARQIQQHIEAAGFRVVREFVGHGIGRRPIEDPKVPNYVSKELLRADWRLRPNTTITVEPMVTVGSPRVVLLEDGWTVATADRSPAAHARHTIAITETGADLLSDDAGR